MRGKKKKKNSLFQYSMNKYYALQVQGEQKNYNSNNSDNDDLQSSMYPSDYSYDSNNDIENDLSEDEIFGDIAKDKGIKSMQSIRRDRNDSLEVIDEESRSKGTSFLPNSKSALEIEEKFTTKLLDTKVFDTKRQLTVESKKIESNVMTEGGKLFEDYLKRNSLLSKQSSIQKTCSISEFAMRGNPHYKNTNAVLSLTESKSKKRNSFVINNPSAQSIIPGTNTEKNTINTGTKSNKSSKASKKDNFDLYLEIEAPREFTNYFPKNNIELIVNQTFNNDIKKETIFDGSYWKLVGTKNKKINYSQGMLPKTENDIKKSHFHSKKKNNHRKKHNFKN